MVVIKIFNLILCACIAISLISLSYFHLKTEKISKHIKAETNHIDSLIQIRKLQYKNELILQPHMKRSHSPELDSMIAFVKRRHSFEYIDTTYKYLISLDKLVRDYSIEHLYSESPKAIRDFGYKLIEIKLHNYRVARVTNRMEGCYFSSNTAYSILDSIYIGRYPSSLEKQDIVVNGEKWIPNERFYKLPKFPYTDTIHIEYKNVFLDGHLLDSVIQFKNLTQVNNKWVSTE